MRFLTHLLFALLLLIQYPLWLGKGGWLRVGEMDRQLQLQNHGNEELRARNASLAAEVKDLKEGAGAVEERARYELGMIKEGELFVQILDAPLKAGPAPLDAPPRPMPTAPAAGAKSAKGGKP